MALFIIFLFYLLVAIVSQQSLVPVRFDQLVLRLYCVLSVAMAILLLLGSWSLWAASSACLLLAGTSLISLLIQAYRVVRTVRFSPSLRLNYLEWMSIAALFAVNSCVLVAALAPVTSWDATTAHLAVPSGYVRADRVGLLMGNVYSAYPQLYQTFLAVVMNGGSEVDAALASWVLCGLACFSVYALGARLGGRAAGLAATAMFATSPIFVAQAGTVAIDVPFTGFIASALLGLMVWDDTKNVRYLIIAGAIAGAACGIRHTGYLAALLMFVWVAIQSTGNRTKFIGIFAASAALASAPWWLRSWILVGNPVYPLLTSVFGNGGMPDVQVTAPLQHETAQHAGMLDFLTFPWRIAMYPQEFDGWQASPGGLVLALGVVGVLWGGRIARWLGGFSLAGILTIYMVQRFARYLLPFFMPLHVTGALAATRPGPLRRPIAVLLVLTYIYGLGLAVATTYQKWPVVFGRESRDAYLTRRVERYPAFQWLNAHAAEPGVVLTLDPRSFYIRRDSFQNLAALEELRGKSIDDQLAWMAARQIRYILVPDAYVAGSPIFRERGLAPLVDQWRADARFRAVYDEELPNPRGGDTERVTILEVVGGDGGGPA